MRLSLQPQRDQLQRAREVWRDVQAGLPAEVVAANNIRIPKETLSEWFDDCIRLLNAVCNSESVDAGLGALYQTNIVNIVPQVEQFTTNAKQQGLNWATQNTPQLFSNLWTVKSSLLWLAPFKEALGDIAVLRMADLASKASAIEPLSATLQQAVSDARSQIAEIDVRKNEAEIASEAVKGHEREAGNARMNAQANAAGTAEEKQKVDAIISELSSAEKTQQILFNEFEHRRTQIDALLEGASKVGLARSFSDRRKSLQTVQWVWFFAFSCGIVALVIGTWYTIRGIGGLGALVTKDRAVDSWGVATHILLAGPLVWFTWFAARQYGYTLRLIEDYAFKEASALSFVGYRNEMGDDEEMLKLLRQSAIHNFGANPTRMLDRPDAASPLHELVDKAVEKGTLDKLLDIVRALNPLKK